MTTRTGALAAAVLGAAAAAAAALAGEDAWVRLAVFGAAVVLGELLELRPAERTPIPLSYAVLLVLVPLPSVTQYAVTVLAAELVASVIRRDPAGVRGRLAVLLRRLLAAAAALAVYRALVENVHHGPRGWIVLVALLAAGVAALVVEELGLLVARRHRAAPPRERSAELALVASGMLMSVGYWGIDGRGAMGFWGPVLFAVPLLAAWYSFERLALIRRTSVQTMRALSVVPELGGLVRTGHAARVAALAATMGRDLGLGALGLEYLEAAALLHHLGHVCLDDPEVLGRPVESHEVAAASAKMLRDTEHLAPAGDLVDPELSADGGAEVSVGAQVLRVASAFDELTEGSAGRADAAIAALYSGPGYVYDARVLGALERAIERGALDARLSV